MPLRVLVHPHIDLLDRVAPATGRRAVRECASPLLCVGPNPVPWATASSANDSKKESRLTNGPNGRKSWESAIVEFGTGSSRKRNGTPLAATGPHKQGAWAYELVKGQDAAWRLRQHDGERWTTIQTFTEEPQHFVDVEVANYNTSTNPHSPFVQRPIVVRKDETSIRSLIGREYSVERPGWTTDRRQLTDDEFAATLSELGLALSAQETAALIGAAR